MPERKPKVVHAIICDDIREERGNKITFVGTYGPDIFTTKIPFIFPKLCFVNFVRDIKSGDSISIELINPSGKRLGNIITNTMQKNGVGHENKTAIFAIFSPLRIHEEGLHKLKIIFNDDDKSKNEFAFNIKVAEKPK
jgi:hypothetical protein